MNKQTNKPTKPTKTNRQTKLKQKHTDTKNILPANEQLYHIMASVNDIASQRKST